MKRKEAIETIMNTIDPENPVVSTTGLISREIFEVFDSERNVYVPGSMGLVSSIGLGIALSCPKRRVVVIDGDASLLMNLGSIVTIGKMRPPNLLHVVIDNNAYGSCSEEKSMSDSANLDKLARNVGYQYVVAVNDQIKLRQAVLTFKQGPGFILARIELGGRRDFIRPLNLADIKNRFMLFVTKHKGENHDV